MFCFEGYPVYGAPYVPVTPLSPPYSPAPPPGLPPLPSLPPTLSPPPAVLEVRSRLSHPLPMFHTSNSYTKLQNKSEDHIRDHSIRFDDHSKKTYASVVITDPKTGRTLDLKKLATDEEIQANKDAMNKQLSPHNSPQSTVQSVASTSHSMVSVSVCLQNSIFFLITYILKELETFEDAPLAPSPTEEKPRINGTHLTNGVGSEYEMLDDETYVSDEDRTVDHKEGESSTARK